MWMYNYLKLESLFRTIIFWGKRKESRKKWQCGPWLCLSRNEIWSIWLWEPRLVFGKDKPGISTHNWYTMLFISCPSGIMRTCPEWLKNLEQWNTEENRIRDYQQGKSFLAYLCKVKDPFFYPKVFCCCFVLLFGKYIIHKNKYFLFLFGH